TTYRTNADSTIEDVVDFFAIHRREGVTEDAFAPVLTVSTVERYDPAKGFDPMTGVSAYDNFDGDLTDRVTVSGAVDPTRVSTLVYTVTDAAGNTATATRQVMPTPTDVAAADESTVWSYLDGGEMPFDYYDEDTVSWTLPGYDDSAWKRAKGPFGELDGQPAEKSGRPVETQLDMKYPAGSDLEGENITNFFFRTTFDLADPGAIDHIWGSLWTDDGAEVYINGVKVLRIGLHDSDMPWTYGSIYDPGAGAYPASINITDPALIASLGLKKTGNVLAVEVWQVKGESDDVYFGFDHLEMSGTNREGLVFTDVPEGSWYYLNVAKAYVRGLFSGMTPTTFAPGKGMTRAMVWMVLARVAGAKLTSGERWYTGARLWAVGNGVSDGTAPDKGVTREQLVTMLYALTGKPDADLAPLDGFKDKDTASAWAKTALCWAIENGMMTGRGGGTLAPKSPVTRAEACTIVVKYIENVMSISN
ncbi:MAG: S-layer homology domain-containing protein, partial [Clostridia bacterium]|nr:S-layer homology domain-containing protein [Clostridia bacterium]